LEGDGGTSRLLTPEDQYTRGKKRFDKGNEKPEQKKRKQGRIIGASRGVREPKNTVLKKIERKARAQMRVNDHGHAKEKRAVTRRTHQEGKKRQNPNGGGCNANGLRAR